MTITTLDDPLDSQQLDHQELPLPDNVKFDNQHPSADDCHQEILQGLRQKQKVINPKFFYDARGSALFDQITRLAEYYLTRTEQKILNTYSAEIADCCGRHSIVIEPGSGSSEKVRLLLNELRPRMYIPIDISAAPLQQAAVQLGRQFPWLRIHAICADFTDAWTLSGQLPAGKRVIFYPGSTIGNLDPHNAVNLLTHLGNWMGNGGGALIGVDLHKPTQQLQAAYDDAAGVTAAFNRNVLHHLNQLLGSDFDPTEFEHRAHYDEQLQRIEMHLVSRKAHRVNSPYGSFQFAAGETIHTENSYKYTIDGFAELAEQAGLRVMRSWLDEEKLFSVHYLEPAPHTPPA